VYEAYVTGKVPVGSGLVLDAGIFASPIGFESFFSKNNFNYTRSWMGDLSPYYLAGLRAAMSFDAHWSATLMLVNGWTAIDVNRGKTAGGQLAWTGDALDAAISTLIGPELPGDDSDFRFFLDLVLQVRPVGWLQLVGAADLVEQQQPGGHAHWKAAAVYARARLLEGVFFAARAEVFDDPRGAITGSVQTLREVTATLELRPIKPLILKLEVRHDWSTAPVFHGADAERLTNETLLYASVVATY
jgi:hypothetical protein